jgi:hypothetical protein
MPTSRSARQHAAPPVDVASAAGPDSAPTGGGTSTLPFSGGDVPVGDAPETCSGGKCALDLGTAGASGPDQMAHR